MPTQQPTQQPTQLSVSLEQIQGTAPRSFGVLLKRYRVEAGLTQEELAERSGLSVRGLSDLERGERTRPHPNTLGRLATALRLTVSESDALRAAARPKPSQLLRPGIPPLEHQPPIGGLPIRAPYEGGLTQSDGRSPPPYIWVPIVPFQHAIGSLNPQRQDHPQEEIERLEQVQSNFGVLVRDAHLIELTGNPSARLNALHRIMRALSATDDEESVVNALYSALSSLMSVELVELVVEDGTAQSQLRLVRSVPGGSAIHSTVSRRSPKVAAPRYVLESGHSTVRTILASGGRLRHAGWVPIIEKGQARGALGVSSTELAAYEQPILSFLQEVADGLSLALRNAKSNTELEAHRLRLNVVNAVGGHLTSSLDRWAIARTVRDELSRHLQFDIFSLATVEPSPRGPVGVAHTYDSGEEQQLPPVLLASTGPAREAFEGGQAVLVQRSPWAPSIDRRWRPGERQIVGNGFLLTVTRVRPRHRVATRSIIWVPVRQGQQICALLSLQSYRAYAFTDLHVKVLQDVAAHVGLALSAAKHFSATQAERRRLELFVPMRPIGASDSEAELATGEEHVPT